MFLNRAATTRAALVDGAVGLVWSWRAEPHGVFAFRVVGGVIVAIDIVMDPATIRSFDIQALEA